MQDIVQDRDGFLWLASWGGLYRFDGEHFVNYKTDAVDGQGYPRSNRFIDLETDNTGKLWALAFDNSLYYLDTRRPSFQLCDAGGHTIRALHRLESGQVCIVTADNTFLFPQESSTGSMSLAQSRFIPASTTLNGIIQDNTGLLWLMTGDGLYRERERIDTSPVFCAFEHDGTLYFGAGQGRILLCHRGTLSIRQTSLHSDISLLTRIPGREGWLVGNSEEGVFAFDEALERSSPVGRPNNPIGRLRSIDNRHGHLLIYSEFGAGIDWFDPERQCLVPLFDPTFRKDWDPEGYIAAITTDNQGDLWISSFPGGLKEAVFLPGSFCFKPLKLGTNVSNGSVRSLFQYGDHLLAGTRDGKLHLLDKDFSPFGHYEFSSPIYSITQDSSGALWIGTRGAGLAEIPSPAFTPHSQPILYRKSDRLYGSPANQVFCVREGPGRRLWICSFDDGLSYLDLSLDARDFISKRNLLNFPSTERKALRCITFGPDSCLYTGGQIGLYVCRNPEAAPEDMQFTPFTRIRNYDIQDVLVNRQGKLFACSYGNGFLVFDSLNPESDFREYTVEDGLLSNFILSVAEDENGALWIATDGGLNRFDPHTGSIVGYSYERLGFPMRFNEGSILKAADGTLYFNTTAGIFYFNPEKVTISSYVPELRLLSCYVGKQEVPANGPDPIRLRSGEFLSLEFAAIDLAAPGHVLYSYCVDGKGEEWISLSTQNRLTLGPFRVGHHRVLLRSTNGDGFQVDNILQLDIQATTHPLASHLAIAAYLLVIILANIGFFLARKRKDEPCPAENPYLKDLHGHDRKQVAELLELLEGRLDDGTLDMDAIADGMNLSRSALYKKTKSLTGKSPMDLLRELRMVRARELVATGSYTISQIAFMTGFNDAHYFSNVFKKETGKSPSEYRESNGPRVKSSIPK